MAPANSSLGFLAISRDHLPAVQSEHVFYRTDPMPTLKQQVRDLRHKHSITEKKKWNARETAEEAALDWH